MSSRGESGGPSVLILDCSTSRGSVALALANGARYWGREFGAGRGHGGELFQALDEALRQAAQVRDFEEKERCERMASLRALAEKAPADADIEADGARSVVPLLLSEILVGLGPGSYSGVRQSIAAANGLAAAVGARLRGFASPLALRTDAMNYHAVGDARRGAFYYTAVESRTCVHGPELVDGSDALHARLAARPDWPLLAVETIPTGLPTETPMAWPSALHLPLSHDALRCEPPLEPIYLRPVSITLPNVVKPAAP